MEQVRKYAQGKITRKEDTFYIT